VNPEPSTIIAGDTLTWLRQANQCQYPDANGNMQTPKASAGWSLSYTLVKSGQQIQITAAASGDDFLVSVAAATTTTFVPGTYSWVAYVTKGTERHQIDNGTIWIKPNLATMTLGYDNRSHVKKVLDALEATIEGVATREQLDLVRYGTGNDNLQRDRAQLIMWHNRYKAMYQQEQAAEKIRKGMDAGSSVYVRF
jgi:hypothetical protein